MRGAAARSRAGTRIGAAGAAVGAALAALVLVGPGASATAAPGLHPAAGDLAGRSAGAASAPATVLTTGAGTVADGSCPGVSLVVDRGDLPRRGTAVVAGEEAPAVADVSYVSCEPTTGPALDVLRAAGVGLEGTTAAGLAFVCRVDGRPGPDELVPLPGGASRTEPCVRTPPSTAYWSLWTGRDDSWTYATRGVGDIDLGPGDAFALVYAVGRSEGLDPAVSPADARRGDLPDGWVLREPASGTGLPDDGPGPAVVVGVGLLLALVSAALVVRRRRSRSRP